MPFQTFARLGLSELAHRPRFRLYGLLAGLHPAPKFLENRATLTRPLVGPVKGLLHPAYVRPTMC